MAHDSKKNKMDQLTQKISSKDIDWSKGMVVNPKPTPTKLISLRVATDTLNYLRIMASNRQMGYQQLIKSYIDLGLKNDVTVLMGAPIYKGFLATCEIGSSSQNLTRQNGSIIWMTNDTSPIAGVA